MPETINENAPAGGPGQTNQRLANSNQHGDYIPKQSINQFPGDNIANLAGLYLTFDDAGKAQFNHFVLHPDELPAGDVTTGDAWQPITMADITQPQPPTQYLAAGLLELPSVNIFYGAPGTLKSFLIADLLVCIAAGKTWLEPAPWQTGGQSFPTIKNPVMWIDFDMGRRRTIERFAALAKHYKTPTDAPITIYSMSNPPLDASNPGHIAELVARVATTGAKLIVFDNLGTISGGIEENSSAMIGVMFNLRWLADVTGAAIVIIHHQRKGNGIGGRAGDALRGHSSIEAAIDLALQITREPYAELINIEMTKSRGLEVYPFSAAFTFDHNNAGDLETAAFYSIEPDDKQSNRAIEREIKTALQSGGMIQTALWQAVKDALPDVTKNRILDYIKRMVAKNDLNMVPGINNSRVYTLPVSRFSTVSRGFPENRTDN